LTTGRRAQRRRPILGAAAMVDLLARRHDPWDPEGDPRVMRHRVLVALGIVERKFNINQPRDPHTGKWIDMPSGLPDVAVIDAIQQALAGDQQVYWRFHGNWAPEFSSENAYSAAWGGEFSPTGDKYRDPDPYAEEEWIDADPGYSSTYSADELAEYFEKHFVLLSDDDGEVIAFHGGQVGTGIDGEPLVVPEEVVGRMPYSQFLAGLRAGLWAEPA